MSSISNDISAPPVNWQNNFDEIGTMFIPQTLLSPYNERHRRLSSRITPEIWCFTNDRFFQTM